MSLTCRAVYRPRLLLCPRNVERTQGQMDSRGRGQTYSLPFLLIYVSGRSCFLDSVFPFLASFLRRHSRVSVLCNPAAQPVILTESELCWWLLSCLKCTVNIWREIQTQIFSIYVLHSICILKLKKFQKPPLELTRSSWRSAHSSP